MTRGIDAAKYAELGARLELVVGEVIDDGVHASALGNIPPSVALSAPACDIGATFSFRRRSRAGSAGIQMDK